MKTWADVSRAICNSNKLRQPGPKVFGRIGKQWFWLDGAWVGGRHLPHTVCVRTEDRQRFLYSLTMLQLQKMRPWLSADYELYSGFYVPFTWFEEFSTEPVM